MVKRFKYVTSLCFGALLAVGPSAPAEAQGVLNERQISLALAEETAEAAIMQCRGDGFRVTVTVVDCKSPFP